MIAVIVFLLVVVGTGCVWGLICNERTLRERIALIDSWEGDDYEAQVASFHSLTYEQHLWARMTFREPNYK